MESARNVVEFENGRMAVCLLFARTARVRRVAGIVRAPRWTRKVMAWSTAIVALAAAAMILEGGLEDSPQAFGVLGGSRMESVLCCVLE